MIYAGEELKITVNAEDFDGSPLVAAQITLMTISIYNPDQTPLVSDATMTWDNTERQWYYVWNTAALDPGTYRAKVIAHGLDGGLNFEWKRLRLAKQPISA